MSIQRGVRCKRAEKGTAAALGSDASPQRQPAQGSPPIACDDGPKDTVLQLVASGRLNGGATKAPAPDRPRPRFVLEAAPSDYGRKRR